MNRCPMYRGAQSETQLNNVVAHMPPGRYPTFEMLGQVVVSSRQYAQTLLPENPQT